MEAQMKAYGEGRYPRISPTALRIVMAFLFLTGGIFPLASLTKAAQFDVDTPVEFQSALTTAQANGEDDIIHVAAGTYIISSTLEYQPTENFSLTIAGADRETTIVDGNHTVQIFRAMISGLSNAHLTIENMAFQNGRANFIGALWIGSNSGNVIIRNSKFINNSAATAGALGIEITSGDMIFVDNIVTGNEADGNFGGAVLISYDGPVTVTGNQITGNTAGENSAGITVNSESGSINFSENTVVQNSVSAATAGEGRYAGAYILTLSGPITFHYNTIATNSVMGAQPFGENGGISGGVTITSKDGSISINGNRINGNTSNNYEGGGAALTESGPIVFTNNLVFDNTAIQAGGGFALISSTGAIYAINNTIYHNTATVDLCGGLCVQVRENDTDTAFASAYIYNNIVWDNSAGSVGEDIYIDDNVDGDAYQGAVQLYFNNFTDRHIVDGSALSEGDNIDQDPQLTADFHILAGSPCVDAGDSSAPQIPAEDIDQHTRVIDGDGDGAAAVDMGADEYTVVDAPGGGGGGCFIGVLDSDGECEQGVRKKKSIDLR